MSIKVFWKGLEMEHLRFETLDMVTENIDKIAALFPSAITEMRDEDGEIKRGVNFEVLKQLLSRDVVDGDECYEFTWVGKKAAMAEAARPITKTLRPVKADSRDWDTTENLYIEGDNLEVLKILQESYLGKVKMIYIDPPYNTGNDGFVYPDDFSVSPDEYDDMVGLRDEESNILFRKNPDSNPRFHSDWCSMLYSRFLITRNLLSSDGVIFISIDDNEYENLKKICDEVFGSNNFISPIIWKRKRGRDNSARWFSKAHEFCLVYSKNKDDFEIGYLELDDETKKAYRNPDNDPRGIYRMLGCWARGTQGGVKYDFMSKTGEYFSERLWLFSKENLEKLDRDNKLIFKGDNVYRKMFIYENKGKNPETLWEDVSNAANASDEIKRLFGGIIFDTPKPVPYIKRMIQLAASKDSVIMDFFSGSATTAHAVMQLNSEDGGHRKFIMVQLSEKCDEASEAYKAGYKNICEIGKERIRRAGDKIQSEHPDAKLDTGFRVFRVDESNMEDVYYHPEELTQTMLGGMVSNIKPDRTDLDLLYACLLDWGVEISLSHTQEVIDGCTVHNVDNGALCACFDERVPLSVIDYMAKQQPLRAVFRDSSFAADDSKINVTEIFKNLSPDTKVKVI